VSKVVTETPAILGENLLADNLAFAGMFLAMVSMGSLGGYRDRVMKLGENIQHGESVQTPESVACGQFIKDRRLVHDHSS
jgi:hypothetical protein